MRATSASSWAAPGATGRISPTGCPPTGPTAELNDPRGLAVGPTGALFVTDGFMHVIRVVPAVERTLFGRAMKAGDLYTVAGALPVATAAGSNDGTRWVVTQMGTPVGVAVSASGALFYARRRPEHGAGHRIGERVVAVSRFGRRTFLASSAGVAAGAVAAGAWTAAPAAGAGGGSGRARRRDARRAAAAAGPAPRQRAHGQRPDGPRWGRPRRLLLRLDAAGARAAARRRPPTGSWCGAPTRATPALSGTAAPWTRPGRPSSPTPARRWPPTPPTAWTVQARAPGAAGGPVSAPATSPPALRDADWQAATWLTPAAGLGSSPTASPTCATRSPRPPAPSVRATAYVSAAHTYRLYVDGAPVDAWPSFSYPDEQYVRAVDLTAAVPAGATQRHRRAAPLVRAGPGPAGVGARPALPALRLTTRTASRVVHVSDGHVASSTRPNGCPRPSATPTSATSSSGWTGGPIPQGWSSPGFDDRSWSPATSLGPAGTRAVHRDLRAAHHHPRDTGRSRSALHTLANGAVVADFGAVYAARPRVTFASGEAGADRGHAGRATCSIPTGRSPRCTARRRPTSPSSYIMRAGSADLRGVHLSSVSATCRSTTPGQAARRRRHGGRSPGTPPCPTCPAATFSPDNRMLNAVWRLCARSCLYLQPGAVRRHADPGEGPVPLGRGQRVRRRHARLRRPEHDLAGPARRGPRPGPLLARRAGQRGLPQRRRRPDVRDQHGALPRMAVALLHARRATAPRCAPRSTRRCPGPSPGCGAPARTAPGCSTGWPTPTTATPSTATTSRWRPTRPATCWP